MLCGYLPFDGDDDAQNNNVKLFQNILECEPELPDFLSRISKDLIMRILNPDPDKRITIEQIKKHPFYLKGKTCNCNCLSRIKSHGCPFPIPPLILSLN
jgi:serine/threonine protein kinase